jgi:hypothetical protein
MAAARKTLQVKRPASLEDAESEPETTLEEPAAHARRDEGPSYTPYIVMGFLALAVFGAAILLQVVELHSYYEIPPAFPILTPQEAPVAPAAAVEPAEEPEAPEPEEPAPVEEAAEPAEPDVSDDSGTGE